MNPSEIFTSENAKINTIQIYSLVSKEEISFSSFITDFNDQHNSNWSSQEIYGRMDPIYTYKNTVRKITLAFDVPSYDMNDAKKNYEKINSLMDSLYPMYNSEGMSLGASNIVAPPLFRIYLHNLIDVVGDLQKDDRSGLLGWIDGVSFKPDIQTGFFVDKENQEVFPKLFKVNFNFNVMHEGYTGNSKDYTEEETEEVVTEEAEQATPPGTAKAEADQGKKTESATTPAAEPTQKLDKYVELHYKTDRKIDETELQQINKKYIELLKIKKEKTKNSPQFQKALAEFSKLLAESRKTK